jgi:antitoxin MazE
MKVNIVEIGNSKGIRIPAPMLRQLDIESQVELKVEKNQIILRPIKNKPRDGWDKAFKLMHERKDDAILDKGIDAEMEDWEWK